MPNKQKDLTIGAESIVSGRNFEPLVNITFAGQSIGQFPPEAARQFAGQVLEAAEAAESDAFIFRWISKDIIGTAGDHAENYQKIISEFKAFRDARRDPNRTKY